MQLIYSSSGGGMLVLMEALKRRYQVASWNDAPFFLQYLKQFDAEKLIICAHGPDDLARLRQAGRPLVRAIINTRNPRDAIPSLIRKRLFSRMIGDPAARQAAIEGRLPPKLWSDTDSTRLASYFDFGGQIAEMHRLGAPSGNVLVVDMAELLPEACPATERKLAGFFGLPDASDLHLQTERINTWAFFLAYHLTLKVDLGIPVELAFAALPGMTLATGMRRLMMVPDVPVSDRPGSAPYRINLEIYWRPLAGNVTEPSLPIVVDLLQQKFLAQFQQFRNGFETALQQSLGATEAAFAQIDVPATQEAAWQAFASASATLYDLRPDLAQAWRS